MAEWHVQNNNKAEPWATGKDGWEVLPQMGSWRTPLGGGVGEINELLHKCLGKDMPRLREQQG